MSSKSAGGKIGAQRGDELQATAGHYAPVLAELELPALDHSVGDQDGYLASKVIVAQASLSECSVARPCPDWLAATRGGAQFTA
jgi:hypothetical protein